MKLSKNLLSIAILVLTLAITAQALPVTIDTLEINDVTVQPNANIRLDIEKGDSVSVRIKITAQANIDNVEILGFISGYEYNDITNERISDVTQVFQLQTNVSYVRTLRIPLPLDAQVDDYKLRIIVSDRFGQSTATELNLKIDTKRHDLKIMDVILIPGNRIKSGSSLLAKVRIENKGQRDEDDVKVVLTIPALGISATDYIDEIKNNDRQDETEEMFLKLPRCAEPGVYKLLVDAYYSDGRKKESITRDIEVAEDLTCKQAGTTTPAQPATPAVVAGTQMINIAQGQSTIIPFTITNTGNTQQGYTISFQAPSQLTIKVSPTSTIIVQPGKTETVYASIQAGQATGAQTVTATVTSGTQTISTTNLTINVEQSKTSAGKILQGILIALVALLVLIGLVMAFRKAVSDERTQPYY